MLNTKNILRFLIYTQILILFLVYYIEYAMDVYACKLCKYQRIPFFLNILLIFLILKKKKFYNFIYILLISISINIGISFYHIGIERGFFTDNQVCIANKSPRNEKDLLKELTNKKNRGCANVKYRLFKLSLSELNFLTNIVFLLICVHIIRNEKKYKN